MLRCFSSCHERKKKKRNRSLLEESNLPTLLLSLGVNLGLDSTWTQVWLGFDLGPDVAPIRVLRKVECDMYSTSDLTGIIGLHKWNWLYSFGVKNEGRVPSYLTQFPTNLNLLLLIFMCWLFFIAGVVYSADVLLLPLLREFIAWKCTALWSPCRCFVSDTQQICLVSQVRVSSVLLEWV